MPEGLQRRRVKGWRKPPGSVIVDRTSRWGNPFRVGGLVWRRISPPGPPHLSDGSLPEGDYGWIRVWRVRDRAEAVALFREHVDDPRSDYPSLEEIRAELAGRDLLCTCPLDGQPCHRDVLLELANPGILAGAG